LASFLKGYWPNFPLVRLSGSLTLETPWKVPWSIQLPNWLGGLWEGKTTKPLGFPFWLVNILGQAPAGSAFRKFSLPIPFAFVSISTTPISSLTTL